MAARRSAVRRGLAPLTLTLLVACGGSSSTPPQPGPQPLRFGSGVRVGGLCCLIYRPRVAATGDRVFVAWTEAIRYTTYIPLRRSSDSGASFPDALEFDDAESGDRDGVRLAIAAGGVLNLVWEDSRNGRCDPFCQGYQVFTTRSADGGARFESNRPIAGSLGDQQNPVQLIAEDGDIFAAWQQRGGEHATIQLARSLDAGVSYQSPVPVDAAPGGHQTFPAIAMQPDGRVFVAWLDYRSGRAEVYLSRSLDRGATFGAGVPLHPSAPEVTDRASVQLATSAGGRLIAVWAERRNERWQLQVAISLDGGQSFTTPRSVEATAAGDQTFPDLVARASGEVYLAWQDHRSGVDRVRVVRSTDAAESFEASVPVDDSGAPDGDQRQPALFLDTRGDVLAVWVDFSKASPGIYFASSVR